MLILAETAAGYAVFKAKDKILKKQNELVSELSTAQGAANILKLKKFVKFENTIDALDNVTALIEGKVSGKLANMLGDLKGEKKTSLVVSDPKLGNAINKLPGLGFSIISDSTTQDLYRGIRQHLCSLIDGLTPTDISTMSLGLSHSLSRHKLKFSVDKVDTMIVQAIALLDDLDKELNIYAMRVKEWYGWHFPEMAKIISDNLAYARVIRVMGFRTNAASCDLSTVLPEELERVIKATAQVSMGTEITGDDLLNINLLVDQVLSLSEYRTQLSEYLVNRMTAIAPNLTVLVGELVGARLIAHAGSLMNLAKQPASTIQILGAEKALFRALKTKHDTPKYGLIYHASLIGQASTKNKGKIARILATKASLSLRVDALSEDKDLGASTGIENRAKVEARLRQLEGGRDVIPSISNGGKKQAKFEIREVKGYNEDGDSIMVDKKRSGKDLTNHEPNGILETRKKEKKRKIEKQAGEEKKKEKNTSAENTTTQPKPHQNANMLQPSFAHQLPTAEQNLGFYGKMIDSIGTCIVSEGQIGLVLKFGKYERAVDPGLCKVNPLSERLQSVDIKIQIVEVPQQTCMTKDNVNVLINSVIYYHITSPYKATFGITSVRQALIERTQTTLRHVLGARVLQDVIERREEIAQSIQEIIKDVAENWGVKVESILIKDIGFSLELQDSLSMAAQAKRIGESKIISAKAEVESAKLMRQAADILASKPAMQIRYLEAMQAMAKSSGSKVIFMPSVGHPQDAADGSSANLNPPRSKYDFSNDFDQTIMSATLAENIHS
ncbi:Nucleolar protein 58 [Neolecta irregularis DAH-3]|uniref:Nucleolar protein 58 n=1 Tax=Neolecta irregularis (strain DAH-3) TaxID=1198029 RepID=A0A1U7LMX2_NEOID|nr:Nucleolar protein 58 [Neolecta irregularis DAH-3]|eukprot:OLL24016.1 Nucleolar protein 58 [Neolecta irregularis DAH-3]